MHKSVILSIRNMVGDKHKTENYHRGKLSGEMSKLHKLCCGFFRFRVEQLGLHILSILVLVGKALQYLYTLMDQWWVFLSHKLENLTS